jgi:hypothetical protein
MSRLSFNSSMLFLLVIVIATPGFGQTRVGKFGVGVDGSMQYLLGAGATNPSAGFGGGFSLSGSLAEGLSVRSKFAMNQLKWKGATDVVNTTDLMTINLYLSGDLMPNSSFNVFPFFGGGMVFYDPRNDLGTHAYKPDGTSVSSFDINWGGGLGFEFFPNEFWSITLMGEYVMTGSSYYAGSVGLNNPSIYSYARLSLQFRYYFFDQGFITKLLQAQRDRLKRR